MNIHNTYCGWCNLPLIKTPRELKQRRGKPFYCSNSCKNFDRAKSKPFVFGILNDGCLAFWKNNFGIADSSELFSVTVTEKEAEKIFSALQLLEAIIRSKKETGNQ